jgi:hypothetical protein
MYLESYFGNDDKNTHVQFDLAILFLEVFPKYGAQVYKDMHRDVHSSIVSVSEGMKVMQGILEHGSRTLSFIMLSIITYG